ncbi:MAG: hypothetical protein JST87_05030 [Bacteroidetes bacterium]|nr:hypothetical protein [Bacteroidota bacterium]MBS1934725.1 hypothetical protein [Bacteroidota bacterium]
MKKLTPLFFFCFLFLGKSGFSQQINPADLIGTWDQTSGSHPATIIFLDTNVLRYSYKGHTGTSRKFYYQLDNENSPVILKVDRTKKHTRNRNIYLIQLVNPDTLKLQVLYKKDSRDHFDESQKNKIVMLVRRK